MLVWAIKPSDWMSAYESAAPEPVEAEGEDTNEEMSTLYLLDDEDDGEMLKTA